MKGALVLLMLLAMSSPARAENRTWQGVFAGSFAVGLGGGFLTWYGTNQLNHAERRLCEGGAYSGVRPECAATGSLTDAEVAELNDRGERGSTLAKIGAATIIVAGGFAAYAFYKGFVEKGAKEPAVVVAPTVSRDGAGAALQLRW